MSVIEQIMARANERAARQRQRITVVWRAADNYECFIHLMDVGSAEIGWLRGEQGRDGEVDALDVIFESIRTAAADGWGKDYSEEDYNTQDYLQICAVFLGEPDPIYLT